MSPDLEFNNSEIPTKDDAMTVNEGEPPSVTILNNLTNFSKKGYLIVSEDSVKNNVLNSIAIQSSKIELRPTQRKDEEHVTTEDSDEDRINEIVGIFINLNEFNDFIQDLEITDAIKRLVKEKGYNKKESKNSDNLFQQIEKHFSDDDHPTQLNFIRRVGEELEKHARNVIHERRKRDRSHSEHEKEDFIASEMYNEIIANKDSATTLDYYSNVPEEDDDEDKIKYD